MLLQLGCTCFRVSLQKLNKKKIEESRSCRCLVMLSADADVESGYAAPSSSKQGMRCAWMVSAGRGLQWPAYPSQGRRAGTPSFVLHAGLYAFREGSFAAEPCALVVGVAFYSHICFREMHSALPVYSFIWQPFHWRILSFAAGRDICLRLACSAFSSVGKGISFSFNLTDTAGMLILCSVK